MSGTGMMRRDTGQPNMFVRSGQRLRSVFYGTLLGLVIPSLAFGQATLLPNAEQQYLDDAANPVASGTVTYYVPSTTTKKTVWQDAAQTTPQSNPVLLDAAGRPQPAGQTFGLGTYRQVVKDVNGVTIWDNVTSSFGSGGGGSGAFSEGVMVGAIIAWANPVLPPKYLYTAGQAVSRASFPDLLTALTFQQVILCSTGVSTITVPTTVSDSVPIGTPIEASCFAPGVTVSSKASGLLTMSSGATATASVPSVLFPWGNGNGSTTFNVPDLRGRALAGRDNMTGSVAGVLTVPFYGVNPDAVNAVGGSQSGVLGLSNLPPYTPTGTVASTSTAINLELEVLTVTTSPMGTNVYVSTGSGATPANQTPTITSTFTGAAQGGTSVPISKVQPTLTADYIIKALPDDLPSGPGVTSIQGMTGAIFCDATLICTAQTISVANVAFNYATLPDMYAGTSTTKIVSPSVIWPPEVTVTYGTTTTFNMSTFRDAVVTLTGDITTMTLTGVVVGKSGRITFIQDGGGGHTTVWDSKFKFAGGIVPTLTATGGAIDILNYDCRTSTFCYAAMMNDVK